jgi:hypothetical protein
MFSPKAEAWKRELIAYETEVVEKSGFQSQNRIILRTQGTRHASSEKQRAAIGGIFIL